ncbi:MAG: Flp pilus assembly complex ATPase component TadA, partial [Planctomycetes bacterium]|nr:Flp pilus assembly complex ATPase component TadA [Planctomycetota bacterium]
MIVSTAIRLGEQLVADGLISQEQLGEALSKQESKGGRLGATLVDMGALSSAALVNTLASQLKVQGCVLRHGLIDPKVAKCIPREEAERLHVLPIFRIHDELTVAMTEPQSLPTIDRLVNLTGCSIRPVLALEDTIGEFQKKYLAANVTVDSFLAIIEESDVQISMTEAVDEGPITDLDKMVDGSPVVNLVNLAVLTALRAGASDIHIEPDRTKSVVRFRVDGALREVLRPRRDIHPAVVSRIKVMANMDIAEHRLPQDGRINVSVEGRKVDLRVSTLPTVLGEKVVMRILDRKRVTFDLDRLGLPAHLLPQVKRMLAKPYGLVLVTGPTGSGKTTTLYSALELLKSVQRNIVTVEDPVEYQLELINQLQVHAGTSLTFASA